MNAHTKDLIGAIALDNRHDPYTSCENCPIRSLRCRTTCEGWASREKAKEARYAARENARKSFYYSAHYRKSMNEKMKSQRKS